MKQQSSQRTALLFRHRRISATNLQLANSVVLFQEPFLEAANRKSPPRRRGEMQPPRQQKGNVYTPEQKSKGRIFKSSHPGSRSTHDHTSKDVHRHTHTIHLKIYSLSIHNTHANTHTPEHLLLKLLFVLLLILLSQLVHQR